MTATADTLDITQIKELLPHRYPFLLVDRVTEVIPGKRAVGYKNLTANEEFFQGHFPFKPIMPGVLMVEACAQMACISMLTKPEWRDLLGVFTGIDGFKFRAMAGPGDRLDIEVNLIALKRNIGKVRAIAKVGDAVACEGDISFAMIKKPE